MYNRYIPQPDGSYRRDRVNQPQQATQPRMRPPAQPAKQQPVPPPEPPDIPPVINAPPPPLQPHAQKEGGNITGFFRRLLPKDLDTADLLIVILLLLIAGDKEEDQTNALLTLALYFFL